MTLVGRFRVYLVVIHLVFAGAAAAWLLPRHRPAFLGVELFFALSLVVGFRLVAGLTGPLGLLRNATRSLAEGDFTTRLRPVGPAEMDRLIDVYNRMIDRLREERVRGEEQESFLRRILAVSPLAVITLDLDGRIAAVNPEAARLLGESAAALPGRKPADVAGPLGTALAGLAEGETRVLPLSGPRRVRAHRLAFVDRGFRRHVLLAEELTEELRRSEKAAYDRLIRLMSHEVNNTSGAVSSVLQSCGVYGSQLVAADRADFSAALEVAANRLHRMNDVMKQFADVVRLPAPRPVPGSVGELLRQVESLMRPGLERRGITWVNAGVADLPPVPLDAALLELALINIVKNAGEAMTAGGTLTVRLNDAPPRLVIADTGPGIPAEAREQLFTSFFTTKENGQGIGLTVVREVLLGHGFDFALEDTGGGSAFTIRFPG